MYRAPISSLRALAFLASVAAFGAVSSAATPAFADVKREGVWPEQDKPVSLDLSGATRSEAVKKLADAAGFSVVFDNVGPGTVDLRVKEQPATRVLDLVLDDASYVSTRDQGGLVRIRRVSAAPSGAAGAAVSPEPSVVPAAAVASANAETPKAVDEPSKEAKPPSASKAGGRGEDRTVFGGNVRIDADETVKDLTAFGGNVEVLGRVTGDLNAFGGNVHVLEGGHVGGDATLLGGNLTLDRNTAVDGDVSLVGGNLKKADGASVGGNVERKEDKHIGIKLDTNDKLGFLGTVGHRLTSMAMLFVFGTILLALAAGKMESMRVEVAARPMRTFALGVVGFFASIVGVVMLCVTIIGIPLAVIGVFLAILAGYAGATAALTTVGAAVLGHRTKNPYVHLAFGCAALFVIGLVPFLGGIVSFVVATLGMGVIFATRGAGMFARKPRNMGPYRSDPSAS